LNVNFLEDVGTLSTCSGQVTNRWLKDSGESKIISKGPALLRILHVLHGKFGSLGMTSFFRISPFPWRDGKWGFRMTSGYISTE
jgi:hypothetical protein